MILPPLPGDDDPRQVADRVITMARRTGLFGAGAYRHLLARMPMSAAEQRHARACLLAMMGLEIDNRLRLGDPALFVKACIF